MLSLYIVGGALLVFALFGALAGCHVARQRRREKERELLAKQTSPGAPGMPPMPSAPEPSVPARPAAERRTFSVAEERSAVKIQAVARGRMDRVEKLVFERYALKDAATHTASYIPVHKIREMMAELGRVQLESNELEELLTKLDPNDDGHIDFNDFHRWWVDRVALEREKALERMTTTAGATATMEAGVGSDTGKLLRSRTRGELVVPAPAAADGTSDDGASPGKKGSSSKKRRILVRHTSHKNLGDGEDGRTKEGPGRFTHRKMGGGKAKGKKMPGSATPTPIPSVPLPPASTPTSPRNAPAAAGTSASASASAPAAISAAAPVAQPSTSTAPAPASAATLTDSTQPEAAVRV